MVGHTLKEQVVAAAILWRKNQVAMRPFSRRGGTICKGYKDLVDQSWHRNVRLKELLDQLIAKEESDEQTR